MAKTVKRILSGAVCLALLFTMLCLSGCEKSYIGSSKQTLEKLNIQAQILNSGDMNVVETWKVNLKNRGKAYHKIYKTFGMLPEDKDFVDNFSVYDEDNHMEYQKVTDTDPDQLSATNAQNTCYLYRTSYEQELGLFMPEIQEGVRTFTFRYTVKRQVKSYKDTSVFYYKFISKNFTVPITNMTCTIKLPSGAEDLHAWLHCTSKSNLNFDSGNQITITANEIPVGTQVETRICMPPTLFSASTVVSNEKKLESIKSEELKWASDWQAKQRREYILTLVDVVGGIGLVLLGILLIVHRKRKYQRCKVDVPEYTHDIPEGNSPAGIANLFYYYDGGAYGKKGKGNVLSATFLELARKGYLTFSQSNKVLTVFLTEKYKNRNWADLSSCEHRFLGLICSVAKAVANEGGNSFTMEQFKEYAISNYLSVDSTLGNFFGQSSEEISQRGYFKDMPTNTGWGGEIFATCMIWIAIPATLIIAGVGHSFSNINPFHYFIPIAAIICGILIKISYRFGKIKPLNEIGEHDLHVWLGLKKYMLEFSRMKEYGVPQLELWEEYLVYATMMGISKDVCQQLKLVYPEINDHNFREAHWGTSSYLYFMFDSDMTGSYGGSFGTDFDLGSVLSASISDISYEVDRLVNPPSSGGGFDGGDFGGGGDGGGGFDGGGGGFDGGGGGID